MPGLFLSNPTLSLIIVSVSIFQLMNLVCDYYLHKSEHISLHYLEAIFKILVM